MVKELNTSRIGSLIVPSITPYDEDLTINTKDMEALASRYAEEGVTVFVSGTTGEIALLLPEEKRKLVQAAKKGVAGRVPVLAGSGWPNPYLVLEEARVLEEAGADILVVPPPYYYPVPQYSVEGFYQWLSRSTRIPIMIYTIPSHTGIEVSVNTILSLSREENIVGVKATVPNILYQSNLIREVKRYNPGFLVYSGLDSLLLFNLASGGDGGVIAGCNLTPKLHAELVEDWRSGNLKRASRLNQLIQKIAWVLEPARSLQGGIKAILAYEGVISSDAVRPPLPLEDDQSRKKVIGRWRESGLRDYF